MTKQIGSGRGERELKVRVKDKKKTPSQKAWLQRQLNDPYVARARREGFRSRAAFKLIEIDDKHHILKRGAKVVDLGAAPGGWTQVAVERVKPEEARGGVVIGIDITPVEPIAAFVMLALSPVAAYVATARDAHRFVIGALAAMAFWFVCTIKSRPRSRAIWSRNSIISRNLYVVSTCSSGNGMRAGQNALRARCSITMESLPPENSSTGRSNSAATSRMMWMLSASSAFKWVRL